MLNLNNKSNFFFDCLPSYETNYIKVGYGHSLYFEQYGNPKGIPILFLHGGPGAGFSNSHKSFFNPEVFRVIFFDQRGSGKSIPYAETNNNNTQLLISDIESLRKCLKIDKWYLFGGSWGSTLSLAYAQKQPQSISELILRGIFMLRKKELQWFYQDGASRVFPEACEKFLEPISVEERNDLMSAYHKIFSSNDKDKKLEAAVAWSEWEGSTSTLSYAPEMISSFSEPQFALAFALIENHYFINNGFLENENQLISKEAINKVRHIPAKIIQGRYDLVCPMETAWELSKNWPEAELIIAPSSGHSAFEKEITHELIKATEEFANNV